MQLGKPGDSSACSLQSQAKVSLRGQTFLLGSGGWKGCLEAFLWFNSGMHMSALLLEIGFTSGGAASILDAGVSMIHLSVWIFQFCKHKHCVSRAAPEAHSQNLVVLTHQKHISFPRSKWVQEDKFYLWLRRSVSGCYRTLQISLSLWRSDANKLDSDIVLWLNAKGTPKSYK